jgi:hypothetical protein
MSNPPRPVTGIALLLQFMSYHSCEKWPKLVIAISCVSAKFAFCKCEVGTSRNGC